MNHKIAVAAGKIKVRKETTILKDSPVFASFSTNDLKKTKDFYSESLGLDVTEEEGMGLSLNPGKSFMVFIYPKENHEPASFTVLNFQVDDIDSVVDDLIAKGISFETYESFEHDDKGICRTIK
jgi:catechol 2,3-dioxygenase-like lactoylglutathione lyase family enzyme